MKRGMRFFYFVLSVVTAFYLVSGFSFAFVISSEVFPANQTAFRNSTAISLMCNATALGENSTVLNVSLFHNMNGTWTQVYTNITNISNSTTGGSGVVVQFPLQFSNQSNGSFSWSCYSVDNSSSVPAFAFGTNRTVQVYSNFSVDISASKPNGEIFPFSSNIFVDFLVNGPTVDQFSGRFYNCTLLSNITPGGTSTIIQNNNLASSIFANNGTEQGFFPGENQGRHPPFIISQINIGTAIGAGATVGYKVNCTDPNNVSSISQLGIFSISPGNNNFFDPSNFNFSVGGEPFRFSSGPPTHFGEDTSDFGRTYTKGTNIIGIAQRDGPFIESILEISGNKFDQSSGAPCQVSDPFSCTNYTGTRKSPRCSKNASDTVRTFYTFYIDIDGNSTNRCNVSSSEDGRNYSGFDVQLFINLSSTTSQAQLRFCNSTPANAGGNNFDNSSNYNISGITATLGEGCDTGNVDIKWDFSSVKSFLRVPSAQKVQRWYAKSGNLSGFVDSLSKIAFYTEGTFDFIPFDPSKCQSNNDFGVDSSAYASSSTNKDKCNAFSSGSGFLNQSLLGEECFNGLDDDSDGYIDAADDDCSFRKDFTGTDTKAPTVVTNKADAFDQSAFISWSTNEPSRGIVTFYGTNETGKNGYQSGSGDCNSAINRSIVDDPIPSQTFDDFRPFHNIVLDSTSASIGFSLSVNTTYFYKMNSTDRSNNTAISNCLSFKTKLDGIKFNESRQVFFPFNDFGSFGAQFKLDTGKGFSNFDPTSPVSLAGGSGFNLQFQPPDKKFGFTFKGVDLTGNVSLNFSNAFKVNKSRSTPFVGMNHDTWLQLVQDLKVDSVEITIPSTGDKLFKCAEDGASNCTDVTSLASLVSSSSSSTTWSVGTDIGFSALSMVNSSFIMSSDQNEYACYPSCSFIINYTNNDTVLGNGSLWEVAIFNNTENSQISIDSVKVLNLSNGSTFVNISAGIILNLSINTNAQPLQFNVTVLMSAYTESLLNITISINGTRRPAFRPYVRSINLSGQPIGQSVNATNLSLDFKTTIFSDFDTNQSCNFNINSSQGANVSSFRGLNGTQSVLAVGVQTIADGTYNWNVSCMNSANETAFSGETRTIALDAPPLITSISISTSGTTTKTNDITINTNENATCKFAESNAEYNSSTLSLMSVNSAGTTHTSSVSYTSASSGTYYFRCNETNNNYMKYSNSTSYSVIPSSSSGSSGSSGGGGGGGFAGVSIVAASASRQWDVVQAGTSAVLDIKNNGIAITSVAIDVKTTISSPSITVEALSSNPKSTSPVSKVYQYLQFTKANMVDSDASKITINFKVPKSWLATNGVSAGEIELYRYSENQWSGIPTAKSGEENDYIMYQSVTPGFSTFAIGMKESKSPPITSLEGQNPEQKLPEETTPSSESGQQANNANGGEEAADENEQNQIQSGNQSSKTMWAWISVLVIIIIAGAGYYVVRKRTQRL